MKLSILAKMLAITGITLFLGAISLTMYIYDSQMHIINTIQSNQKNYIEQQLERTKIESIKQ